MRPSWCLGAVLLAVSLAWAALADPIAAQADAQLHTGVEVDATGSLGPTTTGSGRDADTRDNGLRIPILTLSDEQRARIFHGIMSQSAPVADLAEPDKAAHVPGSVPLQDLPQALAAEVPAVEGYKFVKLDDRILLVDPNDRVVVAELPRYRLLLQ